MAKNNNKYNGKIKDTTKKEKAFQNPAKKLWGKIIIAVLALAMCMGGLISLIYLIVNYMLH